MCIYTCLSLQYTHMSNISVYIYMEQYICLYIYRAMNLSTYIGAIYLSVHICCNICVHIYMEQYICLYTYGAIYLSLYIWSNIPVSIYIWSNISVYIYMEQHIYRDNKAPYRTDMYGAIYMSSFPSKTSPRAVQKIEIVRFRNPFDIECACNSLLSIDSQIQLRGRESAETMKTLGRKARENTCRLHAGIALVGIVCVCIFVYVYIHIYICNASILQVTYK